MESLVAIGIDVHKDKFALVAILLILGAQDQILGEIEVGPDYKEILAFIESIKQKSLSGQTYSFVCGYEAGCLGYVLYHQLTAAGLDSCNPVTYPLDDPITGTLLRDFTKRNENPPYL